MARRKKLGKFEKAAEARRLARKRVGTPPAERVIPNQRRKPAKHKKQWLEEELL
jgi:hypothetical protein